MLISNAFPFFTKIVFACNDQGFCLTPVNQNVTYWNFSENIKWKNWSVIQG